MYIDRNVHQQLLPFFGEIFGGLLIVEKGHFVYRGKVSYYDNSIENVLMLSCRAGTFEHRNRHQCGECEIDYIAEKVIFADGRLEFTSTSDGAAQLFFKKNIEVLSPAIVAKVGNALLTAA